VPGVAFAAWLALTIVATLTLLVLLLVEVNWVLTLGVTLAIEFVGLYILFALKVADQWEKAVIVRFDRSIGLRGPGTFWIVPIIDRIPVRIDHRVMVTPFSAEKALTKDSSPVDVDAVLFWLVWDAEKVAHAKDSK
jgi:regulator of protease activity HflC (stomatin/prohibitin superfamily)